LCWAASNLSHVRRRMGDGYRVGCPNHRPPVQGLLGSPTGNRAGRAGGQMSVCPLNAPRGAPSPQSAEHRKPASPARLPPAQQLCGDALIRPPCLVHCSAQRRLTSCVPAWLSTCLPTTGAVSARRQPPEGLLPSTALAGDERGNGRRYQVRWATRELEGRYG